MVVDLKAHLPVVNHNGGPFLDFSAALNNKDAFQEVVQGLLAVVKKYNPNVLVGVDFKGGFFASALAHALGLRVVLVRSEELTAGDAHKATFDWRGKSVTFALKKGLLSPSDRVVVVEDFVETGKSLAAVFNLLKQAGAKVLAVAVVVFVKDYEAQHLETFKKYEDVPVEKVVTLDRP